MSVLAYLSLGSNLGDRLAQIQAALDALRAGGDEVLRASPVLRSAPLYVEDQPAFFNATAEVRTSRSPFALLKRCLQIERQLGRRPGPRWGPRAVDLDIVFYGDWCVVGSDLIIPHPRWWERRFVLEGLAYLSVERAGPRGNTVAELLAGADIQQQAISQVG